MVYPLSRHLKYFFLALSILLSLFPLESFAQVSIFPYNPRSIAEGYFTDTTFGEGDIMLPVFGNADWIFYGDGWGKVGTDDGWLGSFGGGYRGIVWDEGLLGTYLFGDYNRTPNNNPFWVLNPGIEGMTNWVDLELNGYFPVSDKRKIEETLPGEEFGIGDFVRFTGHDEFDNLFDKVEEVGNGMDGEVGITIPGFRRLRVFAGGYFFDFNKKNTFSVFNRVRNVGGVLGGVEMPMNNYFTLTVRDSYDNLQRNTTLVTLRVTLGGLVKGPRAEIHDRMLDPIRRHLGTWDTGTGIPSQKALINTGRIILSRRNIWFFTTRDGTPFVAGRGLDNCTIEHPCPGVDFNQTNINTIDGLAPRANLFFDPGSYFLASTQSALPGPMPKAILPGAGLSGPNKIALNNGQSMFGRVVGYKMPASDNDRPEFIGSLQLLGSNLVTNLNVTGRGTSQTTGIYATGASNLILNQVMVSNYRGADGQNFGSDGKDATGIIIKNGDNIILNQVMVNDIRGGAGHQGSNGQDGANTSMPGQTAGDGSSATNGGNGGNATGIMLSGDTHTKLNFVSAYYVSGGEGGQGGAGGNGGDASQPGNNENGRGGRGGAGGEGGTGGQALGIELSNSQASLFGTTVAFINSGNGGAGGNAGNGGNANANDNNAFVFNFAGGSGTAPGNTGTGGGGLGGSGGNGAAGGNVTGVLINGSDVNSDYLTVEGITSGAGGNGGIGGNGGSTDSNDNVRSGIAGGGAAFGGIGGVGSGAGGIGGNGGQGGTILGLGLIGSNASLSHVMLVDFTAGSGGTGGAGGNGGSADANNDLVGIGGGAGDSNSVGGTGAGAGGNGGQGGAGGEVLGISVVDSTAGLSKVVLANLTANGGGAGGAGGNGGSADSNNSAINGVAGGGAFDNGIGGKGGGNGGIGGNGGQAGRITGIAITTSSVKHLDAILNNFDALGGGNGGAGGAGGHADANNNTNIGVAGGGIRGSGTGGTGAGVGGQGGSGGSGGNITGISVNNSTVIVSNLLLINFNAQSGGNGGVGGIGGHANALNNGGVGVAGGGAVNGGTGGTGGGTGGTGGNGGQGGVINSAQLSGTNELLIQGAVIAGHFTAGQGGNGGRGGNGGGANAIGNGGGNVPGKAGNGGTGGNGGAGGNINGIAKAGGNGGNGGNGGDALGGGIAGLGGSGGAPGPGNPPGNPGTAGTNGSNT